VEIMFSSNLTMKNMDQSKDLILGCFLSLVALPQCKARIFTVYCGKKLHDLLFLLLIQWASGYWLPPFIYARAFFAIHKLQIKIYLSLRFLVLLV
jgi:hypothetical protein